MPTNQSKDITTKTSQPLKASINLGQSPTQLKTGYSNKHRIIINPSNTSSSPANLIIRASEQDARPKSKANLFRIHKINKISSIKSLEASENDNSSISDLLTKEVEYPDSKKTAQQVQSLPSMKDEEVIDFLASQIVGRNLMINTPFGDKLKLYADYTASGQELKFVSDEMKKVTEFYANTHTESSFTGSFMNKLLSNAEDSILKACKASSEDYFIVTGGTGSTHAIEMAQKFLGTYIPPQTMELISTLGTSIEDLKDKLRLKGELPLVLVSGYEHHSNEITWRKQLCDVISVAIGTDGNTDMAEFEKILTENKNRKIISSFSAGSNVTGLKTNVVEISQLVKKFGGICLYDYAAVGPYVQIDLSQKTEDGRLLIDGLYISPHKFLGGPGSCGVLIFNKKCYNKKLAPTHGGGGTVDYVGRNSETYTDNENHREKSGTPGVLQIIKCGLAFQLKDQVQHIIDKKEVDFNTRFFEKISTLKNIKLFGSVDPESKVSIMSFNVLHHGPKGTRWIHPALVVRLLSDIFGIQARSGCSCAGPYGHHLLNIDNETSSKFNYWIAKHQEVGDEASIISIKPGWARINLHFTMKDYEMDYILSAMEFLNDHAYKFLPLYKLNASSGTWTHVSSKTETINYQIGDLLAQENLYAKDEESRKILFKKQLADAYKMLKNLPESKGCETFPEMENLCMFYCEKGHVVDRDEVSKKSEFYKKAFEEKL